MIGKKNVVFGFLYLVFTAALGPYMVVMYQTWGSAYAEKQQTVGRLQQLQADNFEENLETLSAEQIAKANTAGLLSINKLINADTEIQQIKGGPHTHGNLEAVLNILVGITLVFIGAGSGIKQLISWMFILGALLHSGMLYLERVFHLGWASSYINSPAGAIGPLLILGGLLITALVAFKHLDARISPD